MASAPEPPESIILGQFAGLKNTVAAERLGPSELERAINVDLDDAGQLRRRRGFTKRIDGDFHSLREVAGKTFVVRSGTLHRVREDLTLQAITGVGPSPVCYTEVDGAVYFCSGGASGVVERDDSLSPWGKTDGQGRWHSPVLHPTETLGEVAGRLLGDPLRATCLETYRGRIYMAAGKTLWATELYNYHFVDRTRNFMQFEHAITLVMAVDDGLYVGTTGGLYFIKGILGQFQLSQITGDAVLPGSGQFVPTELIHPHARSQAMPTGSAAVFLTAGGIIAGFDGGTCYNLTSGTMVFPQGVRAAALFRQDQGANSYAVAIDSGGSPSANARIGDYVDAEIVRRR